MRPLIFSDLDDTIFQTARKMSEPPQEDRLASRALNGSHSYMTRAQARMMEWLLHTTRFIPVTARSTDALERCTVPFTDYRICSNGAVILAPDGTPDPVWQARTSGIARSRKPLLDALMAEVAVRNPDETYRSWITEEAGEGIYLCVKSNRETERLDPMEAALRTLVDGDMIVHRNDNNLSVTPHELTKVHAVRHLLDTLDDIEDLPVFGMGDSLTDLPFMQLCDMLVVPRRSQVNAGILAAP